MASISNVTVNVKVKVRCSLWDMIKVACLRGLNRGRRVTIEELIERDRG